MTEGQTLKVYLFLLSGEKIGIAKLGATGKVRTSELFAMAVAMIMVLRVQMLFLKKSIARKFFKTLTLTDKSFVSGLDHGFKDF